jgi:hypothetical protein
MIIKSMMEGYKALKRRRVKLNAKRKKENSLKRECMMMRYTIITIRAKSLVLSRK